MIGYIKRKILKSIENDVKSLMIQDIKEQVYLELDKMSKFKVNLREYKLNTAKDSKKINVWTIMTTLPIDEVQIVSTIVYDNGVNDKNIQKFKTIRELKDFCDEYNDSRFNNTGIVGFKEIKLYVWYYYKSKDRKLEAEYFITGSSDTYSVKSYAKVTKTIQSFLEKYPELLI